VSAAAAVAARHEAAELIVGGGLKVPYLAGETAPSFADWSAAAHRAAVNGGYRGPLRAEPGRALVATAGVSAYTIGIVKDNGAGTVFVAVDGGVSDNPRPALYGARYQPLLVREPTVAPDNSGPFQVVGKNCESSDTFAERTGFAREPISGDLLAIPVTGAYTYSMASNYNGLGRPAVVFVSDERSRVVLRREELRDLVRLEAG
jgi:diaminopimelate decarboxylase